jgi:Flp pilus assembly protein TadB
MAIVLFILIAGLWAAFLLPAFFDQRSNAPASTTRDFARTREKLAEVSTTRPDGDAYVRKHAQRKQQQVLIGLVVTFVVTLGYATWSGTVMWLYINIAVAVAIAAYVAMLLNLKARRLAPRAQVVQLPTAPHAAVAAQVARPPVPEYEESRTVRVIAG